MRRSERAGKWPWYVPAAALWVAFLGAFTWYATQVHPDGAGQPQPTPHRIPEWMMTDGDPHPVLHEMDTIEPLLAQHQKIRRTVEEIPGGIRAVTTSHDRELIPLIRRHAHEMRDLFEQGVPVRGADPVYRELFNQRNRIHIKIEEVPLGVRVTETSDDPRLEALIRRRAQAESEFVRGGADRARRHTELPAVSPAP